MRKLAIITGMILWIVAISSLNKNTQANDEEVLSAFGYYTDIENLDTKISGFSNISESFSCIKDREEYLINIANKLSVRGGILSTSKEEGRLLTTYERPSANGTLTLRLVTPKEGNHESYLFVTLDIKDHVSYAFTYKKLIEEICPNDTSVLIGGTVTGHMDYSEKCILADSFMKRIGADIISENRSDEMFIIYGYTDMLSDSITIQGERINISMSIEYDETRDTTSVHIATPVETFND